jgi:hypothetical protein
VAPRKRLARLITNEAGGLLDDHGAGTEILRIPGNSIIRGDGEADRQAYLEQEVRGHGYSSAAHRVTRISEATAPAQAERVGKQRSKHYGYRSRLGKLEAGA